MNTAGVRGNVPESAQGKPQTVGARQCFRVSCLLQTQQRLSLGGRRLPDTATMLPEHHFPPLPTCIGQYKS